MIVALVIGAMVLTAILGIYARANRAADAVLARIDSPSLGADVLQLIVEDLERLLGAGDEATIEIRNGFDSGFVRAQLILRRTLKNDKNEDVTVEEITWRAGYDYEGRVPGLILYRGHEGIAVEDKLLDPQRETWERNYPLVPVCRGVTFLRIEVPRGDEFVDRWSGDSLPPGVRVSLSFAEPYETVRGTYDVLDHQKITRTIAVDRTRKIKFTMPEADQAVTDETANDEKEDEQPPEQTNKRD
jgi:hypothetical protein